MDLLIPFLKDKGVQIILVIIQNTILHALLLNIQFTLMDIKMPARKVVKCAFFIALVFLVPMYLIDMLFYYPAHYTAVTYAILIFDNPLYVIAYFYIIKNVFRYSSTRAVIMLRNQVLLHYIVVLTYMVTFNFLISMGGLTELSFGVYWQDFEAILIMMALLVVCNMIVKRVLRRNKKYIIIPPNYFEKNVTGQILGVIFSIFVMYVIVVVFRIFWFNEIRTAMSLVTGFIYGVLIAAIYLYFLNTLSTLRKKLLEWEMQATSTYISSLLHANQEFRGIKHDFYNVLQGYEGYLSVDDYEGLKQYHKKLFNTTKSAGDFLSVIETLKSRIAVYSLLEAKSKKAADLGVVFSINLVCDITNVVLDDVDLCRVFGIVLDNAIEAASSSDGKQVNISLEKKNDQTIVFIVSNTTASDVDVAKVFNEGFTTKEGHSGIGLTQVMHILNSYEHCGYRASYHENQFTMFLILYSGQ